MNMDELKCGWLAPDGSFFPVGYAEHLAVARDILAQMNLQAADTKNMPDEVLLNRGWASITILSLLDHGWEIAWRNHLSDYQKNFLKPYFENGLLPATKNTQQRWNLENKI